MMNDFNVTDPVVASIRAAVLDVVPSCIVVVESADWMVGVVEPMDEAAESFV